MNCTGCCNRIDTIVSIGGENENETVGILRHPYIDSGILFEILDKNGEIKYYVMSDCGQTIFDCYGCNCHLKEGILDIYKNIDDPKSIGNINRLSAIVNVERFYRFSIVTYTSEIYKIIFPDDASPTDKYLIICLALLIDEHFYGHRVFR